MRFLFTFLQTALSSSVSSGEREGLREVGLLLLSGKISISAKQSLMGNIFKVFWMRLITKTQSIAEIPYLQTQLKMLKMRFVAKYLHIFNAQVYRE